MPVTTFGATVKGDVMKYSEVCLLAGTWLLVSQNQYGWGLIVLSFFLAFARFSYEYNEKKEAREKMSEGTKTFIDAITGIFTAATQNEKSKKSFLH
jgi:hypothetical protein